MRSAIGFSGCSVKIKWIALSALGAVIVYTAAAAYVVTSQNINELVICANGKTLNVPFSDTVCRSYLYRFRGSAEDVRFLQDNGGVSFLLGAVEAAGERRRIIRFFAARGLDVDGQNRQGLRPLQAAVLQGSASTVRLLLELGADPGLSGRSVATKPLPLAEALRARHQLNGNGDAIVALLQAAVDRARHPASGHR